jgi:hypothetical protein
MFEILGVLVGLYVLQSTIRGEVFAKSGIWGRTVSRAESPGYFWSIIATYSGLSVMLLTVF